MCAGQLPGNIYNGAVAAAPAPSSFLGSLDRRAEMKSSLPLTSLAFGSPVQTSPLPPLGFSSLFLVPDLRNQGLPCPQCERFRECAQLVSLRSHLMHRDILILRQFTGNLGFPVS